MTFSRFAKYQLPLFIWIGFIFGISAIPSVPVIKFPISPDKIAHTAIYFVLCLLGHRAFLHQDKFPWLRRNSLLAALSLTIMYGVLDEIHQIYVPGRFADVYDAIADTLGGLLFVGWFRWKSRRNSGEGEPGK